MTTLTNLVTGQRAAMEEMTDLGRKMQTRYAEQHATMSAEQRQQHERHMRALDERVAAMHADLHAYSRELEATRNRYSFLLYAAGGLLAGGATMLAAPYAMRFAAGVFRKDVNEWAKKGKKRVPKKPGAKKPAAKNPAANQRKRARTGR